MASNSQLLRSGSLDAPDSGTQVFESPKGKQGFVLQTEASPLKSGPELQSLGSLRRMDSKGGEETAVQLQRRTKLANNLDNRDDTQSRISGEPRTKENDT